MTERIRTAVMAADPVEREEIGRLVEGVEDLLLVAVEGTEPEDIVAVGEGQAQVALVGHSGDPEKSWGQCVRLQASYPGIAVLKLVPELGEDIYRQALRAGVRDVLRAPVEGAALAEAIYKAHDLQKKLGSGLGLADREESYDSRGKVIPVFSTKGGVGKTTVAVNLAVLLARAGKKTVLVDLDLFAGSVALALDVIPRRSVAELAQEMARLDLELLESFLVRHKSGLMVLAAPFDPNYGEFISSSHVEKFLALLAAEYDYIIVDSPNYLYETIVSALHQADIILFLGNLEIFSVKNLKTTLVTLDSMGLKGKLRLVLNKASRELGIRAQDVENTLGLPIWYTLPNEENIVVASINQGTPLVTAFKNSALARSFQGLAQKVLEGRPTEAPAQRRSRRRILAAREV